MNKISLKIFFVFLTVFIFSGLISCSKNEERADENEVKTAEMESVSDEDISETDEDLLTVDYKEFYDKLAPHGEWIEVKGSDIGVDLNKGTSSGHRSITFRELFGVKDAMADVDFGAFFVWQPAPGLAVGLTAGETAPAYQPYTNGQWVNTTSGWYFRAASEPEETTHHYGRWAYTPALGWVWVPGRVWAPAWVDWRENDEYVAWEPVPPSFYISNNVLTAPPVYEDRYIIVEKRYFIEPEVYRYHIVENRNKLIIKEWMRPEGVMVVNKTVINRGPNVTVIENVYGRPIETVSINYVSNISKVDYRSNEYIVYKPDFKKVKKDIKITSPVTRPEKFSDKQSASQKEEKRKNENRVNNENKLNGKDENKNEFKERKYIDDKNMKNGSKNRNDDNNSKGKDNGKYKENRKNDKKQDYNGNKQKNNNGSKDNGKNKGNDKNNGNNKNGKEKGKGNGNRDNSELNKKEHKEKYNSHQSNDHSKRKNK